MSKELDSPVAPVRTPNDAREPSAPRAPFTRAWRRLARNRLAVFALAALVALQVCVAVAPLFARTCPDAIDLGARLAGPSRSHPLGTDEVGRDVLIRLIYGGRISLGIGLTSMVGSVAFGTVLGCVAGYFGGAVDAAIMRVTDAILSFPLFFFLLMLLALIGSSIPNIIIVIALTSWMNVARVVRAETLQVKSAEFIEAARAVGAPNARILWRHILPQTFPSVIVAATLGVANAILTESALSYLGLGVSPPTASWGNMLSSARPFMWNAPALVTYPGLMIFVTVLLYNALGDGLRDALDPMSGGG